MEVGSTVYIAENPWVILNIGEEEITVKDENGMAWANALKRLFSLEPVIRVIAEPVINLAPNKEIKRTRKPHWENPEKRKSVLERLISNPAAYVAAAWLLRNNGHFHLSMPPFIHEEGKLLDFVHSEILDIQDTDISVSTDLTQGPSFTVTVGGLRPPTHILEAFRAIGVTASKYYETGTTVQKWGFVYDFLMIELGVGFNHGVDPQATAVRIQNEKCRDVFVREMNGDH